MNSPTFAKIRSALLMIILLTPLAGVPPLLAQGATGEIRGKVTSQENGEPIVRATVRLVDMKLGAITDLNGVYTIRKVPPGTYKVRVTFLGYRTEEIDNVVVGDGVIRLDIVMETEALRTGEVVVTAQATRGTEGALLNERRKSAVMSDGISAAQIRRLPDASGADALSRVTGLSIVGSRFVNVRGVNERYNNTQLNGVTMVSTDPGKRAFSFDLVPASLLENTVVAKTFTPDLPGDFSGGLVQLNTIDFPDQGTLRLSLSGGYSDGTTFRQMQLGPRGATDFLGMDDGTRAMPGDFPDTGKINTNNGYSAGEVAGYARRFNNNFRSTSLTAAPNLNAVISYGNRFSLFDNDFGVIAALSYRNGYEQTAIRRYDTLIGTEYKFNLSGFQSEYSVLWGGILNLSYKLSDLHTISVKNTYNRIAEDQYTNVNGLINNGEIENQRYVFQYLERSFYNGQINGDHLFPALGGLRMQWRGFGTLGERDEPDLRRMGYVRQAGDTSARFQAVLSPSLTNPYGAGRIFSNLQEELAGFGADFTLPLGDFRLKFGALNENKSRVYKVRSFAYILNNRSVQLSFAGLDTLYDAHHIDSTALSMEEFTTVGDSYGGESHLRAGYLMADLPFQVLEQRFRAILGARYEDNRVIVHTVDDRENPITVDYPTRDWLPSASLIYEITPAINLRLAYSKTLSRPDFREYSRNVFFDFVLDALSYGNPDLKRPLIDNYDFRLEYFSGPGEVMAVSVFHKNLSGAIEETPVQLFATTLERTWINTDAVNTGIELEVRRSLGFIGEDFSPFSFSVNYTWLDSKVDIDSAGVVTHRRLQGQSPYVINAGLYYDNPDLGTSVSIAFNRFGERISTISAGAIPALVEQPRNRYDVTVSQSFLGNYEARLAIKDLFPGEQIAMQLDRQARVDLRQRSISLGISARF